MSTPFQNRLVGTIIVAAAAIIFLPDVLDGDKKTHQADFEGIPKAPLFASKTATGKVDQTQKSKTFPDGRLAKLPTELIIDEKAIDDEQASAVENNNTGKLGALLKNDSSVKVNTLEKNEKFTEGTSATPKNKKSLSKTAPDKSVAGEAWVIQLGSFRHKNNVDELVAKLKKNGYVAFTKPIKTKNGTLIKVFVGPEFIKSSLEKKIPLLKELTNVQGKVARFYAGNFSRTKK
ncbi:MAG: SPOR domain-containing protein [Alteromonadaceae bacterium]|nr:SPOR domain-containing protein [Alteromonadaceae bacterium]